MTKEKKEEETKEEAPTAEPAPEEKKETVEIPEQFKKLVEQIEQMTVLELNELVKVLEKKFGVSAQAAAVAAPASAEGAGAEQDSFTIELTAAGDQKIQVIKVVKDMLGLGLKEAKDLVDAAPSVLKERVKKEDAEEMKQKIEEVGGSAALK